MKIVLAIALMSFGFFVMMSIIKHVAGWGQSNSEVIVTSLIFGVLSTAVGCLYLRFIRKRADT